MNDLIEALTIIQKCLENYNEKFPTACEHDVLYVCGVDFNKVTVDMLHKLNELGFIPGSDDDVDILIQYDDDGEHVGEIDFGKIDQETWDTIKDDLTNCFRSYKFGSC